MNSKKVDVHSNTAQKSTGNTAIQIKNALRTIPEISNTSIASGFPFGHLMGGNYVVEGIEKPQLFISYYADMNYMNLLNLKIIDGIGFSDENVIRENDVVVNETLAKDMNWDKPVGKVFKSTGENPIEYRVIGVVKDFHIRSFRDQIYPIFLKYDEQPEYFRNIGIKYHTPHLQALVSKIENLCNKIDPSKEYTIHFMSQVVEDEYMEEFRTGKMFTNFAVLAIVIAAMGLYGLALFMSRQKSKDQKNNSCP